jgi:hypothetical protein
MIVSEFVVCVFVAVMVNVFVTNRFATIKLEKDETPPMEMIEGAVSWSVFTYGIVSVS